MTKDELKQRTAKLREGGRAVVYVLEKAHVEGKQLTSVEIREQVKAQFGITKSGHEINNTLVRLFDAGIVLKNKKAGKGIGAQSSNLYQLNLDPSSATVVQTTGTTNGHHNGQSDRL